MPQVGDAFRAAADAYLRVGLTRGVPSLFVDVRPLLGDGAKAACLQQLVEGYRDSLKRWARGGGPRCCSIGRECLVRCVGASVRVGCGKRGGCEGQRRCLEAAV